MSSTPKPPPDSPDWTRRALLGAGAAALAVGSATTRANPAAATETRPDEWRNKQPGMAYRRLGRTGLMVSEVVSGGDPIDLANYRHLALAVEMGLNYFDMAPAYHRGDTERAYGKLLAETPGLRDRVFLATKVSGFKQRREQLYHAVLDGLPAAKQREIRARAHELRTERGVDAPGYYLTYFPGQAGSIEGTYIRSAMLAEFGERVEHDPALKAFVTESLEGSLKRLGVDHVDILHCPHGADGPDDARSPLVVEAFADLKRQGKVRFLGVTAHNDPAGVLRAAADAGSFDVVMMAYNVINGGYVDEAVRHAASKGLGLIAMKSAHAVATHHKRLQPVPEWRVRKVERIVPGDLKAPLKAYLWSLQNRRIAAVVSNLWDETHVRENLALAGKTVELQPA